MEAFCLWGAVILFVVNVVLIIKLLLMKSAVREIRRGLDEKLSSDTNTVIDISSGDRDMRKLAQYLNVQLKILHREKIRCQNGDIVLKEAVTNVSHDLRTPLTAICGYLDLLRREDISLQARRYLDIIAERTDTMKQLTSELLKYSVAVSGERTNYEPEDVTVNNVLEECVSGFYAVLIESGISPEISICDAKVHRMLNKNALSRIFSNIISNAVKYSSGDLKISLSPNGEIRFSNKAPDLDTITVKRLFDRFYTVETGGKSTGLGLSIARTLTEQMGGTISASYNDDNIVIEIVF